jgi:flagellar motor switch protein FliG
MTMSTLTGSQKAAALLVQLGKEHAGRVLATMTETEVEELAAEIVKLGSLPGDVADQVLEEFHGLVRAGGSAGARGGVDVARELLQESLGRARTAELLDRLSSSPGRIPFSFLREADARQILNFVSSEHPQTIALVLAHLRADQASAVLSGLPADLQADVAHRIAVMDRTSPDLVRTIAEVLHRRTSSVLGPVEVAAVGGVQPLVEIINRADPGTEKLILEGLDARDNELAEQVRSRMFVFDDIVGLEDRGMQLVLRQVETQILATALKGVRQEVADKVLRNVSERARENLLEEMDLLGRVRVSQVEDARASVVSVIRALEAAGELVLRRDDDADYIACPHRRSVRHRDGSPRTGEPERGPRVRQGPGCRVRRRVVPGRAGRAGGSPTRGRRPPRPAHGDARR